MKYLGLAYSPGLNKKFVRLLSTDVVRIVLSKLGKVAKSNTKISPYSHAINHSRVYLCTLTCVDGPESQAGF